MPHTIVENISLIQSTLQREQLRSERLRVLIFVGLLAFLLLVLLAFRSFPGLISDQLRPQALAAFAPVAIVLAAFLTYEIFALAMLGRWESSNRLPGARFLYLNTLVEVSFVTTMIVASSWMMGASVLAGALPLIYFLVLSLTALTLDVRLCLFAGAVASAEFLASSLILLRLNVAPSAMGSPDLAMLRSAHLNVTKCALILAGGGIAAFVAQQLKRQLFSALQAVQQRDRAISIFGQHVSPQVAELLLKQPMDFSGQERNVCVMFLDIRDFSRIASDHSPSEVMDYLNALFGFMIPLINDHHGIVNKFLGDGFMAVFGAPVDDAAQCRHAVDAAYAILRRVEELNHGQRIPPTRLGIGLHLGVAVTGNVGSGDRKEYTVIGDVVNLASRIEQATKKFGGQLIVSEAIAQTLEGSSGEDLGMVELKGQPRPVRLFKLA